MSDESERILREERAKTAEDKGVEWYTELARRATEQALGKIQDGDDAGADLSLASTAWNVVMGFASDGERADMNEYVLTDDDGYGLSCGECICPPELVARGGFKSGCPVHG